MVNFLDWYSHNITTLCTVDCKDSVDSWLTSVRTQCAGESILSSMGVPTLAEIVPTMWKAGIDLVCLQSRYGLISLLCC
jgi:hypothetical protein